MSSYSATTSTLPVPSLSLFVLDTGTTGVDPSAHHMQSFSLLRTSTTFHSSASFSTQVRPPTLSPHRGIPQFESAWESAQDFIAYNTAKSSLPILIAHNAPFDAAFLLAELRRNKLPIPNFLMSDSLSLARSLLSPGSGKTPCSQASLAARFGIPVQKSHTAKYDVLVLQEILSHLSDLSSTPLHHLLYHDAIPLKSMAAMYNPIYSSYAPRSRPSFRHSVEHSTVTESSRSSVLDKASGSHDYQYTSKYKPYSDTSTIHTGRGSRDAQGSSGAYARESKRDNDSGKTIWTTDTGACYHGDVDCVWLGRARTLYKVQKVKSHLKPCSKCWRAKRPVVGNSNIERRWVYIAKGDSYFHRKRNCWELNMDRKVLALRDIPVGLDPCARCCGSDTVASLVSSPAPGFDARDSVSYSSEVTSDRQPSWCAYETAVREPVKDQNEIQTQTVSSAVGGEEKVTKASTLIPYPDGFYKTKKGEKFHVTLNCGSIRGRDWKPCFPLKDDKDPCRKCALDLYQVWNQEGWITGN